MSESTTTSAGDVPSTYALQPQLPSLPVPPLEQSVNKYIRIAEAICTGEEIADARSHADQFLNGVGPSLQSFLEQRARDSRNWVEEWWEKFAYLTNREPLVGGSNTFGMVLGGSPQLLPPSDSTDVTVAAAVISGIAQFMKQLKEEKLAPEMMRDQPLCMFQYSRMFCESRVPQKDEDKLVVWDWTSIAHVTILHRDRMYALRIFDADGSPVSIDEITKAIYAIKHDVAANSGVANDVSFGADDSGTLPLWVLSGSNRDTWADARDAIIKSDPQNAHAVDAVESSILVVSLSEGLPENPQQLAHLTMSGGVNGREAWFDKSYNMMVFRNGFVGLHAEHTFADAMVQHPFLHTDVGTILKARHADLQRCEEHWSEISIDNFTQSSSGSGSWILQRISWNRSAIEAIPSFAETLRSAASLVKSIVDDVDINPLLYTKFNPALLKAAQIPRDAFVQFGLQLAYYRLHGEFVNTYETGHTRAFYHGRTDVIRSLSQEVVDFVKAFVDPSVPLKVKVGAFKAAIAAHLMKSKDVVTGNGFDRHLMGLRIAARASGVEMPEFFTDAVFQKMSRFILSTSSIGATVIWGGFCTVDTDGYGACYAIPENGIYMALSASKKSTKTDLARFKDALERSYDDLYKCIAALAAMSAPPPSS